ncbi:MAG TPA: cation:proton antiporter, partial [Acidobacteriota bacterium]|nr:cation:proton antiporter [Acidobacteriota bacterium]
MPELLAPEMFATTLALVGAVIVIAALLSGFIERSGLPQVAVFLALGAILGPWGLSLMNVHLHSPILHVVSVLSLVLVLFTDAVSLDIKEVREHTRLVLRVLGPGTMLSAALMAIAAKYLLWFSWPSAAILGAALASTDPVMLRGLLKRRDLSAPVRQALRLESGLNDAVLLPVVLVSMAFFADKVFSATDWSHLALNMFLLGPGAGVAVGLVSVAVLDLIRRKIGVRRDYESLYSLGVAFAAYSAAEALHGSGFLAAFSAGITISMLDVELCDCFLEYGETTAEMALLFTFVLFGSSLIWTGLTVLNWQTLLFVVAVLLARPIAFSISLAGMKLKRGDCLLIAWFGPRGLSSLLLVLLPIFAGIPGMEKLFTICCAVVLFSIVIHGGSFMLLGRKSRPITTTITPPQQIAPLKPAENKFVDSGSEIVDEGSIILSQVLELQKKGEPVIILDVRSERSFEDSDLLAKGAIRIHPDEAVRKANELGLDKEAWLIAF